MIIEETYEDGEYIPLYQPHELMFDAIEILNDQDKSVTKIVFIMDIIGDDYDNLYEENLVVCPDFLTEETEGVECPYENTWFITSEDFSLEHIVGELIRLGYDYRNIHLERDYDSASRRINP